VASDSSGRASPGGRHIYRYGQSPIGLVTFAFPPFLSVQVGGAVSPPDAVEPLVVSTVTVEPGSVQSPAELLPAPLALVITVQSAATIEAAAAFLPFEVAIAVPPKPFTTSAEASLCFFAFATALPPQGAPIAASALEFAPLAVATTGPQLPSAFAFAESHEVVERTLQTMGVRAHGKGLELTGRIMPGVPHNLIGDPLRLGQVLINLIGNAIKFTERGEVALKVEAVEPAGDIGTLDSAPVRLRFSISDTGIGIPADFQSGRGATALLPDPVTHRRRADRGARGRVAQLGRPCGQQA
jgi:hypothetical protein